MRFLLTLHAGPRRTIVACSLLALAALGAHLPPTAAQTDPDACAQPPAEAVAWWPFDETSGTTAADLAGGHAGRHVNGPRPVAGRVAGALGFDGGDDFVEMPGRGLEVGTGDVSLTLWLRTSSAGRGVTVIQDQRTIGRSVRGYSLWLDGGRLGVQMADGTGSTTCSADRRTSSCTNWGSGVAVADGQWHAVALTIDRDDRRGGKLYLDGVLRFTFDPTIRPGSLSTDAPFRVGSRSGAPSGHFRGEVDELQLVRRALTADEVLALHRAGAAGQCKKAVTSEVVDAESPGYQRGAVVLKLEPRPAAQVLGALRRGARFAEVPFPRPLQALNRRFGAHAIEPVFPGAPPTPAGLDRIFRLMIDPQVDVERAALAYDAAAGVEYAEPNRVMRTFLTPNDPMLTPTDLWGLFKVKASGAWDVATGQGVVVAVVDSGVDPAHPDLAANLWKNPKEQAGDGNADQCPGACGADDDADNLVDEDSLGCGANGQDALGNACTYQNDRDADDDENGYPDDLAGWDFVDKDNTPAPLPSGDHGTHVAGTVAARGNNALGVVGLAFDSRVMAVRGIKVSSGLTTDLVNGIYYAATNGADVVNNSWGGPGRSQLVQDAVDFAHQAGVLVVSAAGNSNQDACGFEPANAENGLTVAATDAADAKASFSNFGVKVDVAAPGVNILSTVLNAGYGNTSGTSMAAPHVSALAALILQIHPNWTPEEVRQAIRKTTTDVGAPGFDVQAGWGRIDALTAVGLGTPPPVASVTAPFNCAKVSGTVNVVGSAGGAGFASYVVEVGQGAQPASFTLVGSGTAPVAAGTLATLDTTKLADGLYTIRVITTNGSLVKSEDRNVVTVDNVYISSPTPMQVLTPGVFTVLGHAATAGLVSHTLEWKQGFSTGTFTQFVTNGTGQNGPNGPLGAWSLSGLPDGPLTLRLTATYGTHTSTDEVRVVLDKLQKPGWPVLVDHTPTQKSPLVADLDGDGAKEVVFGASVFQADGSLRPGWDAKPGLGRTNPAVVDVDGDGTLEVVAAVWTSWGQLTADPNAGAPVVRAFNPDKSEDWSFTVQNPASSGGYHHGIPSSVSAGDLDGDGTLEVVFTVYFLYNNSASATRLFVLDAATGATEVQVNLPGRSVGTVALVPSESGPGRKMVVSTDSGVYLLNPDGSTAAGWPQTPGNGQIDPVAADVDLDGRTEILVGNRLWQLDGTLETGWPAVLMARSTGALVPLANADCELEAVLGGGNSVVFSGHEHTGALTFLKSDEGENTFVIFVGGENGAQGSPVVADVDGDGEPEIVRPHELGFGGGLPARLYGTQATSAQPAAGFPRFLVEPGLIVRSTAAVDDIDGDGTTDLLIAAGGKVHAWGLGTPFSAGANPWPMFQRDLAHTGYLPNAAGQDLWIEDTPYDHTGVPDTGVEPDPAMVNAPMWKSRGIWVRSQLGNPGSNGNFLDHEDPEFGQTNEVWVTVRNKGCKPAAGATVEVYYADASTGLSWPAQWHLIGSAPVPALAAGGSQPVSLPWDPPGAGHYCLVAKVVSAADPLATPETADIDHNVRRNNEIAWRNVNIVNLLKKASEQVELKVRNTSERATAIDLAFRGTGDFVGEGGSVFADLGPLFAVWRRAGGRGDNVAAADGTRVRLLRLPARLQGIPLARGAEQTLRLTAEAFTPMRGEGTSRRYSLDVVQIADGREVGGVSYSLVARAAGTDTDGDGTPDARDDDDDGDRVRDADDADPVDPAVGAGTGGCRAEWSSWVDADNPGGQGDYEMLESFLAAGGVCTKVEDIQCQTLDGRDWRTTGQVYHCEPARGGWCVNGEQRRGVQCLDYRVRFLCCKD